VPPRPVIGIATQTLDAVFDATARTQTTAGRGPEGGQVHGGGGEDGDLIALSGQVATETREISFRAAQCRRISLYEMRYSHVTSLLGAAVPR